MRSKDIHNGAAVVLWAAVVGILGAVGAAEMDWHCSDVHDSVGCCSSLLEPISKEIELYFKGLQSEHGPRACPGMMTGLIGQSHWWIDWDSMWLLLLVLVLLLL